MSAQTLFFALCVSVLICSHLPAQDREQLVLTLEEIENRAFENNLSIRSAELGVKASEAKHTQAAHAKILPQFGVKNVWGPIPRARGIVNPETGFVTSPDTVTRIPQDLRYFTELDLNLVQPIFTFGKLSSLEDAAYFGVQADEANLKGEQENVQLQVRKIYWGLLLAKELLAVIEDAQNELQKAENKIQEKLDEGSEDVTQNDLFRVQVFEYQINKQHRDALTKIAVARASMKTLLGLPEDTDIKMAAEYLDPIDVQLDSLDKYLTIGLRDRPELARLRAGMSAKRASITVAKSDYFPQFFLGGQIRYNFAKDRFDPKNPFLYNPTNFFRPGIVIGLNLNLNYLQTRDKVRVAQVEYAQLTSREKELIDGIKLDILKTYTELLEAESDMNESRKALRASDNLLRSASMSFDIGIAPVGELIEAYRVNGAMQGEHYQNIFEYNVKLAELSKAIGQDLYPATSAKQ